MSFQAFLTQDELIVNEDDEEITKQRSIIDLLVAAGYFRARIKNLSIFDKVVGGMVWCVTLCNRAIDVDLFYSDNSTIGQKIALTEKVVEVLPYLRCPHSIEPHQIQGLDYIHIFPVIQWLVREAVVAKEKQGDSVRRQSLLQFHRKFTFRKDSKSQKRREIFLRNCEHINMRCIGCSNELKDSECSSINNVDYDTQCTLLEYASKPSEIELADSRPSMDANAVTKVSSSVNEKFSSLAEANRELSKLKAKERQLDEIITSQSEDKERKQKMNEIAERIAEHQNLLEVIGQEKADELKKLLSQHDEIKKRESSFKATCKMELQKLDAELQKLSLLPEKASSETFRSQDRLYSEHQRLKAVRLEVANLNQQIAAQQRHVDAVPSQIEISQYQRRVIELYNQIASKHRETKQFYNLHNTLVDIKEYMKREIDLFNSIDDVQELTLKDSYRDSFIENLQKILKAVDASLERFSSVEHELKTSRDKLSEDYQSILEKERMYYKTVDDFRNACNENHALLSKIKNGKLSE